MPDSLDFVDAQGATSWLSGPRAADIESILSLTFVGASRARINAPIGAETSPHFVRFDGIGKPPPP